MRIHRRVFVSAAALLTAELASNRVFATLMRGLPLRDLVAQSHHILLLTALDSRCRYLDIGGRRHIVTETRARIDDVLASAVPSAGQVVVSTLGGKLDGVGELVHGQAEFSLGAPCVAFLARGADGSLWVTGMSQGHYPVLAAGADPTLAASPHLATLRDFEHSAVRALVGQKLTEATRLVREASAP
jgi:hypothetical protein